MTRSREYNYGTWLFLGLTLVGFIRDEPDARVMTLFLSGLICAATSDILKALGK